MRKNELSFVPIVTRLKKYSYLCTQDGENSFSYQFYDKIQNDPVDFLREVYYHHVPRKNDSEGLVIDSKTDQ